MVPLEGDDRGCILLNLKAIRLRFQELIEDMGDYCNKIAFFEILKFCPTIWMT
jgi:hypothetical protein